MIDKQEYEYYNHFHKAIKKKKPITGVGAPYDGSSSKQT
jgi:hypothetical protein